MELFRWFVSTGMPLNIRVAWEQYSVKLSLLHESSLKLKKIQKSYHLPDLVTSLLDVGILKLLLHVW
jgi:hypothetical protein